HDGGRDVRAPERGRPARHPEPAVTRLRRSHAMRPPTTSSCRLLVLAVLLLASVPSFAADKEKLFVATPLTAEKAFTEGIEGPACDAKGDIYAVNFARQQTIGRVTPDGKGEIFVTLPGKSTGNGIVFDRKGMMYVADYVGHNILRIDPATRKI